MFCVKIFKFCISAESPLQLLLLLHLWVKDGFGEPRFLTPILSSLLVIGKVNAEIYLSDELENLMKDKSFLEKLFLTVKHIPLFAVTAFFRIGCVIINNQILKHTPLYSSLARSFPTLFFFFTVWAGAFFFISLYYIIFIISKVAFPNLWPEISMIEIGHGILAELTTVSNWGRLGRDRSRSLFIIAIFKVIIAIIGVITAIFEVIIAINRFIITFDT